MVRILALVVLVLQLFSHVRSRRANCLTPQSLFGKCVEINQCNELMIIVRQDRPENYAYLEQSQCGFSGANPKVCCPMRQATTRLGGMRVHRGYWGTRNLPFSNFPIRGTWSPSNPIASALSLWNPTAGTWSSSNPIAGTWSSSNPTAGTWSSSNPIAGTSSSSNPIAGTSSSSNPIAGTSSLTNPNAGTWSSSNPIAGASSSSNPNAGTWSSSHPIAGASSSSNPNAGTWSSSNPIAGASSSSNPAAGTWSSSNPIASTSSSSNPAAGTWSSSNPIAGTSSSSHPAAGTWSSSNPIASTSSSSNTTAGTWSLSNPLLPQTCGEDLSGRIIGGERAGLDEYPWMALLEYNIPNGKTTGCGGALISKRYVLTAAHCVKGKDLPKSWTLVSVRLGDYDTSTEPDCIPDGSRNWICADAALTVDIEEQIVPESYMPQSLDQVNDIALLRLSRNVSFTNFIRPICLPPNRPTNDSFFYSAGWGTTETGFKSAIKLKVKLPLANRTQCANAYQTASIRIKDSQICAGGERGYDTCRGDSGGPLMSVEPSIDGKLRWTAAGIVSFGYMNCGTENWPGVYTNVTSFMPWIISKLRV